MTVRVYVPTTLGRLRALVAAGGVGPAPFLAHAVTEPVRDALPDGGDEEWEYAAASAAAQASVPLLHPDEPARRVVLALDVPSEPTVLGPDSGPDPVDPTLVEVDEVVPLRRLGAVLADASDAEGTVAAARDAILLGRADAGRLLEDCLEHELGWWAAQEVDVLLDEGGDR